MARADRNKTTRGRVSKGSPPSQSPFIFISHDSRDAKIAEFFSDLLTNASAGTLQSFRSSDRKGLQGFPYGTAWYGALTGKLQKASEVVCLLTQRSLERPWILYEAGVAFGKSGRTALGVALGIPISKTKSGPFGALHNCGDDEDSLTSLVLQLMKRSPNVNPPRRFVKEQVRAFKKDISPILSSLARDEADRRRRHVRFQKFLDLGLDAVRDRLPHKKLKEHLEGAKSIKVLKTWFPESKVIGIGLRSAIIKQNAKVRLLLCKPGSKILEFRSLGAHEESWWGSHKVYQAIKDVHKWVQEAPNADVKIAIYDSWPGCPVIWYDETVLMGFYFRGDSSPEFPWVSVDANSDHRLTKILNDQFDELWEHEDTIHLDTAKRRANWLDRNKRWEISPPGSPRRRAQSKSPNRGKPRRKGNA